MILDTLNRLRCLLFGHTVEEQSFPYETYCRICGEPEVDYMAQREWSPWEWHGILWWPFIFAYRKVARLVLPRCWECHKVIFFRRVREHFCSKRCAEIWIPF